MKERPVSEIKLTNGGVAIVDSDKIDILSRRKWHQAGGYAYAYIRLLNGKLKRTAMHRFLMNTPDELHVDHINHNTLDNRICNLKNCTPKENLANRRSYIGKNNPFYGRDHSPGYKKRVSEKFSKPVIQMDSRKNIVGDYPSILEAERSTGISNGNISSVCNGRRKSAGGYLWKYKNDQS